MLGMTPQGFRYLADFLTPDEERGLIDFVETLAFREVRMHGVAARRTVVHFGYDYDYSGWKIVPTDPPPPDLRFLIERVPPAKEPRYSISMRTLRKTLLRQKQKIGRHDA